MDERCPQCSAFVRAGTSWCTLCHTDLRPPAPEPMAAAESVPAPETAFTAGDAMVVTGPDPVLEPAPPAVRAAGKHARPAPLTASGAGATSGALSAEYTDLLVGTDDTEAAFALLRAAGRDPLLSKLEGPLSSPGVRVGIVIGGATGLALVLFITATLVGAIFR